MINKTKKLIRHQIFWIFLSSVFIISFCNNAFWGQFLDIFAFDTNNLFFISAFYLNLILLLSILLTLVCLFIPAKIVLPVMLIWSAGNSYFSDKFKTIVDIHMITNLIETSYSEAVDLLSTSFILTFIFKGLVPAFIVYKFMPKINIKKRLKIYLPMSLLSVIVIISFAALNSKHYAFFLRQHKSVREYINPVYSIYSGSKYISKKISNTKKREYKTISTKLTHLQNMEHKKELVIFVVGETARSDHFSLNGYKNQTNPLLEKEKNILSFSDVSSCGTSTAHSVPCMFSYFPRSKFDIDQSKYTENALDSLKKMNVDILWRDNNSNSKGVADRVLFEDMKSPNTNKVCDTECRDIGMLNGLQEFIDKSPNDILIVLHQMGSHGPAYFKRYPKEFEKFTPICKTSNLSECTQEEISNTYDNTILYTDYFLSEVIKLLKKNEDKFEASMVYVSDHGESLGENNIYLHALPYAIAPKEQTQVPLIIWGSDEGDIDLEKTKLELNKPTSHDILSYLLLNLFEVEVEIDIKRPQIPVHLKEFPPISNAVSDNL